MSTVSHSDAITGERFSEGFLSMSDVKMEHKMDRQADIQRCSISSCEKKLFKIVLPSVSWVRPTQAQMQQLSGELSR